MTIDIYACSQIIEYKLLKTIDTAYWLNKQLFFQFHYSYSVDSSVNMASKMRKVLTLDEPIKAIKLVESGKSSGKVKEEFGVGCAQIQETLKYGKQCRSWSDASVIWSESTLFVKADLSQYLVLLWYSI